MLSRLNFYDIYGYLLPGIALLAIGCLPIGLMTDWWPPAEWSSALLLIVFGYIAGHIIHAVSEVVFQPKFSAGAERRYPSDYLLDSDPIPGRLQLSAELKKKLEQEFRDRFGLSVGDAAAEKLAARRDAFFLCRSILQQLGKPSYSEQMEGMYALNRGLLVVSLAGICYFIGWLAPSLLHDLSEASVAVLEFGVVIAGGFVVTIIPPWRAMRTQPTAVEEIKERARRQRACWLWASALVSFSVGVVLAYPHRGVAPPTELLIWTMAGLTILAALFFTAFRWFAEYLAAGIYRDFRAALVCMPKCDDKSERPKSQKERVETDDDSRGGIGESPM